MARGWESKNVESQQEEATRRSAAPLPSSAELARADERRSLELMRARAAADLARASRPAHRSMLEATLAAIDARMAALERG